MSKNVNIKYYIVIKLISVYNNLYKVRFCYSVKI